MAIELPALPYARDALQPHISPETIDFQLLAVPPIGPAPPEPAAARVLRAGYFLPEDHVRRIRSIRLRGATRVVVD